MQSSSTLCASTAALESHVSCEQFVPSVGQYRPSYGSSFSNPGVLQDEWMLHRKMKCETSNVEFQRSEMEI